MKAEQKIAQGTSSEASEDSDEDAMDTGSFKRKRKSTAKGGRAGKTPRRGR